MGDALHPCITKSVLMHGLIYSVGEEIQLSPALIPIHNLLYTYLL